jgi:hypothetical protein
LIQNSGKQTVVDGKTIGKLNSMSYHGRFVWRRKAILMSDCPGRRLRCGAAIRVTPGRRKIIFRISSTRAGIAGNEHQGKNYET